MSKPRHEASRSAAAPAPPQDAGGEQSANSAFLLAGTACALLILGILAAAYEASSGQTGAPGEKSRENTMKRSKREAIVK